MTEGGPVEARQAGAVTADAVTTHTRASADAAQRAGEETRSGTVMGFAAYLMWGLFPFYFHALAPSGAWEVLAQRVLWCLVLCALVMVARRDLQWVRPFLARRRLLAGTALGAVLVAANWLIYLIAVMADEVKEASLGYFLNPLVTVALGVFVLGEGLRRLQWAAVVIGVVAGVFLSVALGHIPWLSLGLAFSFGFYGLVKKRVGASLTALQSLTAETTILLPVGAGLVIWLGASGQSTFGGHGAWHTTLLVLSGPLTAVPLLLFAAAARRVPLVTIGLLQFVAPVLQLIAGLMLGETLTAAQWVGFGIVWVALAALSADSLQQGRARRRIARAA